MRDARKFRSTIQEELSDEEEILESNDLESAHPKQKLQSRLIPSFDLHPNKELCEAFNFNAICLFYAIVFEVFLMV